MKILIVGGGGREHALAWKVTQSDRLTELCCAPGNAGTAALGENLDISSEDVPALLSAARERQIDLTIVGPEDPLCLGIVDAFNEAGLRIFGPSAAAARLEGDKAFAKTLMKNAAIPTAEARIFDDYLQARDYIATRDSGLAVKAAGLARGKGVVVCPDPADALLALERIMIDKAFGDAGAKVVVEEMLSGPELSVQALVDGRNIYVLETAQDHKRLGDGDTGPNTGGMGAYSPAALRNSQEMEQQVVYEILVPAVDALTRQGTPYRGVLYAGLMLTHAGPKVLEFNCRFGDPEIQALLPRLQTDLLDILEAVVEGRLGDITLDWDPRAAVCVVMASGGYPGTYHTGRQITGLDQAERLQDVIVFHAGTAHRGRQTVSSGGRVLGVTALGPDLHQARHRAYEAARLIHFDDCCYRRDIAGPVSEPHPAPGARTTSPEPPPT